MWLLLCCWAWTLDGTLVTQAKRGERSLLLALSILLDDEFEVPIYAEPPPNEVDAEVWDGICELIQEVLAGDREKSGAVDLAENRIVWRHLGRVGLTFVAAASEALSIEALDAYLRALSNRYQDEVANLRNPERDGVADVVIDVIPAWEEEDDWAE